MFDAGEDVGRPGLRIDIVALGGPDQAIEECRPRPSSLSLCKDSGLRERGGRRHDELLIVRGYGSLLERRMAARSIARSLPVPVRA